MSRLDLLAGPNGAGKTTLFRRVIGSLRPGLPLVNADVIAAQRWPEDPEGNSYAAARIADDTRRQLVEARLDFATETVFSHTSKVEFVQFASDAGYDVVLHVVMVPLELSIARVEQRTLAGGHTVPPEKLQPRFERLWPLVAAAVPTCHRAIFYDNSRDRAQVVASFDRGVAEHAAWPDWAPPPLLRLTGSPT
ncbi:zeta toxin family protein [Euzebya rosea]|uniref:zeta toxin family protein n=1 Tax=Euzebya rosea TaxID=2052804 RepID=UPI000D3E99A2|nr:zeta toxin family protein [Euzebya rosea]